MLTASFESRVLYGFSRPHQRILGTRVPLRYIAFATATFETFFFRDLVEN